MTRAVTNLCDNASKFGKHVDVTLSIEGRHAIVEVADDGPGIPPELRDRVLEPFYKVDAARSEEHTSELQSLMRTSYAVFCLKKKKTNSFKHVPCITSAQ